MMSLVEHDYVQTATWRMGGSKNLLQAPPDLSPPQHQTEMEVPLTPCRSGVTLLSVGRQSRSRRFPHRL